MMLLLLSVVVSTLVFPLLASRDPNPKRGLKRALLAVVLFNLLYVIVLRLVYLELA
jgi:hypothetical protein